MLTDERSHNSESPESRMDKICDEFERGWKTGERPDLAEHLASAPEAEREQLFPHLLGLELDYRNQLGESFRLDEYIGRFGQLAETVRKVFQDVAAGDESFGSGAKQSEGNRDSSALASGVARLQRVGKYRLIRECGRGGMGIVFKAKHPYLPKPRALKVLRDHCDDEETLSRFRDEMQKSEILAHPNIVLTYDAGDDGGRLYLVMEFVDGIDLHKLTKQHGPLPIPAACEMLRQAAEGLQHAHEHFLVHRDIKPSNLMLNTHSYVKILDFGLARFHAGRGDDQQSRLTTRNGALLGTIDFMAPEQWKNAASVSIQADIYSLGCSMHYLLTGSVPYPKDTVTESVLDTLLYKQRAHQSFPIPKIQDLRPDCPPELQEVFEKLMAKKADDRPDSPAEVAELFEPFASRVELKLLAPESIPDEEPEDWKASAPETVDVPTPLVAGHPAGQPAQDSNNETVPAGMALSNSTATEFRQTPLSQSPPPRGTKWWTVAAVPVLALLALWLIPRGVSDETESLANRLASVPGLNGGWWFDEAQWLTPSLRWELAQAVRAGETEIADVDLQDLGTRLSQAADTNPAYADLRKIAEELRNRLPLAKQQALAGSLANTPAETKNYLKELTERHADLAGELGIDLSSESGFDSVDAHPTALHTLAVVTHRMALSDTEHTATAERAYVAARLAYETALRESNVPALRELYGVLRGDSGRFESDVRRQYGLAATNLEDAVREADSPLFKINSLCAAADNWRSRGSGSSFEEAAKDDLDKAGELAESLHEHHPLRAEIIERRAWLNFDNWQFRSAADMFHDATNLRGEATTNQRANTQILFNQQARAMALHFQGQDEAAIRAFQELLDSIELSISSGSELSQALKEEFRARKPNVRDRLADCYLFGASPDYEKAAQIMEKSIAEAVRMRFDEDRRWPHVARLRFKHCLALTRHGNLKAARKVLSQARELIDNKGALTDGQQAIYQLDETVAVNMLALAEAPDSQNASARMILVDTVNNRREPDRKTIDLMLHVTLYLIQKGEPRPGELQELAEHMVDLTRTPRASGDEEFIANFLNRYLRAALDHLTAQNDPALSSAIAELTDELK